MIHAKRPLEATDVLRREPRTQILAVAEDRLVVRHPGGIAVLRGVALADLSALLAKIDGRRSVAEIAAELAAEYAPAAVVEVLGHLDGHAVQREPVAALEGEAGSDAAPLRPAPVVVIGNGPVAVEIVERLERLAGCRPELVGVCSFAACDDEFTARDRRALLGAAEGAAAPSGEAAAESFGGRLSRSGEWLETAGDEDLVVRCRGAELVISALEGVPYRALFAVQRACLASGVAGLFLTFDPEGAKLGPVVAPGGGPCLACAEIASLRFLALDAPSTLATVEHFRSGAPAGAPAPPPAAILAALVEEAAAILSPGGEPTLLASRLIATPSGEVRRVTIEPLADCPLCGGGTPAVEAARRSESADDGAPGGRGPALSVHAGYEVVDRPAGSRLRAAEPDPAEAVASVGILGGGTAGYLTALALRAKLPHLAVTLIESSAVPIVGVGEATTPLMPQFLHADLGIDVHRFFREVQPTLKLGIRFAWGDGPGACFNYPFGPLRVVEPAVYDGDLERTSLRSLLMSADAVPLFRLPGGGRLARFDTRVAYHLDNRRFVAFLQALARERGVEVVDATVADVALSVDGREVATLVADDGRRFAFDLYIDASGFRSLLVGEALGSPFFGFERSLFTDAAVVATVPHGGRLRPYTLAAKMDAGWCWSVPASDSDHRGYVFSSAFVDPERAAAEMRTKNPGMGEPRTLRFRPGRRRDFWRGNVVAMGNAYGFVEPLESTALHLLIRQIGLLVRAFPIRRGERGVGELLNRRVGGWWDYLRWFLALHFRYDGRPATPFWRTCREEVDVSSHAELVELFQERGPLSVDPTAASAVDFPDPLWGAEGIDVLLLGQRLPARLPVPALDRASWRARARRADALVARAMAQAPALAAMAGDAGLREQLAGAFRAVGPAFPLPRHGRRAAAPGS